MAIPGRFSPVARGASPICAFLVENLATFITGKFLIFWERCCWVHIVFARAAGERLSDIGVDCINSSTITDSMGSYKRFNKIFDQPYRGGEPA